jgi:hypothetical protein
MPNVKIYGEDGTQVVDECEGPTWTGGCPRTALGEPVACAGRLLEVAAARGNLYLRVDPGARACPLATLSLSAGPPPVET